MLNPLALLDTAYSWLAIRFLLFVYEFPNDEIGELARLILRQSISVRTRTGGRIHLISPTKAIELAGFIIQCAAAHKMDPLLVVAWLSGESRLDPNAYNPNKQLATKGESKDDAFRHADVGIAQFDGATLLGRPEFDGYTALEIRLIALDPGWAVPAFCDYAASLLAWAHEAFTNDPSLADKCDGELILAGEAYNVGRTGAIRMANEQGRTGNWKYSQDLVARYTRFNSMLMWS